MKKSGPTGERAPARPLEQGVGADLNRALRLVRDQSIEAESVVDSIVHLGPNVLDPSMLVLDGRKLPSIDGGKEQFLSDAQEARLLEALRKLDAQLVWNAVDAHLARPKGETPPIAARVAAILGAGTCARPEELGRIVGCARIGVEKELDSTIDRALCSAAEDVFRRNPGGLAHLAESWKALPPLSLPPIVEGAGVSGDARALPFLAQVLDQSPDLERIALAALTLQSAPSSATDALFVQLRRRLDPDHPAVCQAACNALGALGDFGSVDALCELLSDDADGVQANAYSALCKMSGLALPAQAASWHAWRVHESEWFDERADNLAVAIVEGNKHRASEALTEIGLHRWERHALSDIVATGLSRPEPELMEQACGVLVQLGSPRARVALQKALATDDPRRLAATRDALAALPTR